MIRKTFGAMLVIAMISCFASIALARGAPNKQKAFTGDQVIAVDVGAPIAVQSVPPLTTGYDVVCNITQNTRTLSPAVVDVGKSRRYGRLAKLIGSTNPHPAPERVLLR